jgi:hypothetical protein
MNWIVIQTPGTATVGGRALTPGTATVGGPLRPTRFGAGPLGRGAVGGLARTAVYTDSRGVTAGGHFGRAAAFRPAARTPAR